MNMNVESALMPEEPQFLAPQALSRAAREELLSASAAETRLICAKHAHFLGAWFEEEVLEFTSIRPRLTNQNQRPL